MGPRLRSSRTATQNAISRLESSNPLLVDAELAKGQFSYIYENSCQKEVKVKDCFPLFRVKAKCNSAIRVLMKEFDLDENGKVGYSAAAGLKIVVKIPKEDLRIVKYWIKSKGISEAEAYAKAYEDDKDWYGIVDGQLTFSSLSELEQIRPDPFQDFKWIVTVIEWQPMHILKAFSRARNMLQTKNVLQITLFDTISAIHEIAHEKTILSGDCYEDVIKQHGIVTKIADEFNCGSMYARETARTLTGAALRIKPAAVDVLGKIINEEDLNMAQKVIEVDTDERVDVNDVFDARAYKNIISTNTIRGAVAFLNATAEDQCSALMRLKFGFQDNGFRCFQASRLNKEVMRTMKARAQINLMKSLMGRDKWPDELLDIERKMLLSSFFDKELDNHDETEDAIMPCLMSEYRAKMPLEAGMRIHLFRREHRELTRNNRYNFSTEIGIGMSNDVEDEIDTVVNHDEHLEDNSVDNFSFRFNRESCPLQGLNVKCLNLTVDQFATKWDIHDGKFDVVTGDPCQVQLNGTCKVVVDFIRADKYISVLKNLILPHGWVFLYTTAVDYAMWDKVFRANGFETLGYPWPMVRDTETVQTNTSPLPQNVTEWLIGARKKDAGSPTFQPDTISAYGRKVSSRKRKFAIMDICIEPRLKVKKPNTREPLRTNQRSPEPMAELLNTFCPPQGNVLDAFAGTLETAKACYLTKRSCTVLEADNLCFEVSVQRLKECAKSFLRHRRNIESESESDRQFRDVTQEFTSSEQRVESNEALRAPLGMSDVSEEEERQAQIQTYRNA